MTELAEWMARHTNAAPAALRERVERYAGGAGPAVPVPAALARAAEEALERVVAEPGDRSVALDLLAADALVTLALLAQAELAPERLGDFATALIRPISDA